MKTFKQRRAITLIEMVLAATLLGILSIFAVSQLSTNAANSARALAWMNSIQTISTNYFAFEHHCDLNYSSYSSFDEASTIASHINFSNTPPPDSSYRAYYNVQTLLGIRPINPLYKACYQRAGLKPLIGLTNNKGPSLQGDLILTLASQPTAVDYVAFAGHRHLLFSSLINHDIALILWNKHRTPLLQNTTQLHDIAEPFLNMNEFLDPSYIDQLRIFDAGVPDSVLVVMSYKP